LERFKPRSQSRQVRHRRGMETAQSRPEGEERRE